MLQARYPAQFWKYKTNKKPLLPFSSRKSKKKKIKAKIIQIVCYGIEYDRSVRREKTVLK